MQRIGWIMGLSLWALVACAQNSLSSLAQVALCDVEPFVAMTHYSRDQGTAVLQLAATLSPSTIRDITLGLALDNNSDGQSDLWILIDLPTRLPRVIATNLSAISGISVRSNFRGNQIVLVSTVLTTATPIGLVAFDRSAGIATFVEGTPIGQPTWVSTLSSTETDCCCSLTVVEANPNTLMASQVTCPPPAGTPKDGDWNGDGIDDWIIGILPGPNGDYVVIVCLDGLNMFGYYYVDHNGPDGWVAKCPYEGGQNSAGWKDVDGDGCEEFVVIVVDGGRDDDGDGKKDEMIYVYDPCNGVHEAKHRENGKCVDYRRHPGPHRDFSDLEFWR